MLKSGFGASFAVLVVAASLMTGVASRAETVNKQYSWATVPWGGGGYVDGFVYHPKIKNLLFARTDVGGVYRYDYDAKRWIPLLDTMSHDDGSATYVLSVAVDPNDANKLYLATGPGMGDWDPLANVLRSDDQGKTWKKTGLSFKLGGNSDGRGTGERLQVDPNLGNVLLLGSNQSGLWKSTDGAQTFAKVGSFPASNISLIVFDPHSGTSGSPSQTVYVGSHDGKGGLWASHDGGKTFALVPGSPEQTPQHAVISPDGFLYVAFATGDGKSKGEVNPGNAALGGIWKLELKTGIWSDITPIKPVLGQQQFGYSGVDIDPAHPSTIVASTLDHWWPQPDNIFISKDGGGHWIGLRESSRHTSHFPWREGEWMGSWISDVKINPFNPDELVYGTGGGLWMTHNLSLSGTDKPVEFEFADDNFEETATLKLVSPPAGATLIAVLGDVGGGSWDDISRSPPANAVFSGGTHRSIDVAWLNPNVLARALDNKPFGYYSIDGGENWTPFPTTPPYTPQDAQGNWRTIGQLAVSAKGTSIVWALPRQGAYHSSDLGKSWTVVRGWPTADNGNLVPIADRAVDGVFYVHDRAAGQILASIDGGATFKPAIEGIPVVSDWENTELAAAPGSPRDLWLAGPFGLAHSAGPSHPMTSIKNISEAWHIGFGKPAPGQTYPAVFVSGRYKGQSGIWRSDDAGLTWVRVNDDTHRFNDGGVLAGDPTEYGTVYVSRGAGGIVVGKIAQ